MAAYPEFFNDVFGPVMQPGSSSHTAAPCRLGRLAGDLLGEKLARVRVLFDRKGSFAGTFGVMAEDRAMVAGVLGMAPDDRRLFSAFELAAAAGVTYSFEFASLTESYHPNAMKFELTGASGRTVTLVGISTGGGMIETVAIDDFPLKVIGDDFVLLLFDPRRAASPEGLERFAARLPDLVSASSPTAPDRGALHAFALASEPDLAAARRLAELLPGARLALLRPVLPVLTTVDRKPQLFGTMTQWREIAAQRGLPLWEIAVQYEIAASSWPRERVLGTMAALARLMHRQTHAAYDEGLSAPPSPFKPDFPAAWSRHTASGRGVSGGIVGETIRLAYGAGAGIPGVETVPGPMGGGGGYVYAALSAVKEARGLADADLLRGLFVAAGVGVIAFSRTEPTGEVIGCTGESGVCGAMAAAAIVEMVGGTPEQAESAASLTLQAFTGLPCDPIPGGLCQPCRSRIMAATCTAHVFADLALAGHDAVLPLHEALDAADAVGRRLPPELLCTSRGGACATPTAERRRAEYADWLAATPPARWPPGNLV
jgi:L-serine dehydratase